MGAGVAAMCSDPWFDCDPAAGFATGLVVGAIPGALVGALIGAAIRSDRWEDQTATVARPMVARGDAGVVLGVSVAF